MIHHLPTAQLQKLEDALGITALRDSARAFATAYTAELGDDIREYVNEVAGQVYPYRHSGMCGQRAEFKRMVRFFLREQGKLRGQVGRGICS